jgi:hypothetical protein
MKANCRVLTNTLGQSSCAARDIFRDLEFQPERAPQTVFPSKPVVLVLAVIFLCASCATTRSENKAGQEIAQTAGNATPVTTVTIEDFSVVELNTQDGIVRSIFDAPLGTDENPLSDDARKLFGDSIIYPFSSTYNLYGKENTAEYYAIMFDFTKTVDDTANIKDEEIIGETAGTNPKLLVFSRTLDPFLIINCERMPYYYDGFYWFYPAFLFLEGGTVWLSFKQTDDIDEVLIEMAEHVMDEPASFTFYPSLRVRFKTHLNEYPRPLSEQEKKDIAPYDNMFYRKPDITAFATEIYAGIFKYLLCWQNGFDRYLQDEYTLNDDLWIYGSVITYRPQNNCGYLFVRDFKRETLETMYEERLEMLKEVLGPKIE